MTTQPARCDKCHEVLTAVKLTSEKDSYCQHCGHVLGTSVQPSVWTCEECGDVILGLETCNERYWCGRCKVPLSCLSAQPSRIHGAGTGDTDLEYGLAFLMEAQGLEDILFDMEAQIKRVADRVIQQRNNELKLGSDILRDSQSTGN